MELKQKLTQHPLIKRWEIHFSLTSLDSKFQEVWKWCWQTFGHPGCDPDTGVKSGWDYHGGWIYIYDERLVPLFLLRWT